jgi:ATP-dependent Clp protease ATP-binding subunit ClpB
MQKEIDDRLATAILGGRIRDGDAVLVGLSSDGEELTVDRQEGAEAVAS